MSQQNESEPLSRSDFLRAAALGTGGVGLLALSGCGPQAAPGTASNASGADARSGYVVTITHGPDDPARVMLALVLASRMPRGDNHVWFAIDGGQLCKRATAEQVTSPLFESQGTAARLLEQIRSRGTAVHI